MKTVFSLIVVGSILLLSGCGDSEPSLEILNGKVTVGITVTVETPVVRPVTTTVQIPVIRPVTTTVQIPVIRPVTTTVQISVVRPTYVTTTVQISVVRLTYVTTTVQISVIHHAYVAATAESKYAPPVKCCFVCNTVVCDDVKKNDDSKWSFKKEIQQFWIRVSTCSSTKCTNNQ